MKRAKVLTSFSDEKAGQIDLLLPMIEITLARGRLFWKSEKKILVDALSGDVVQKLSSSRREILGDYSSIFLASEKMREVLEITRDKLRNQFDIRDRLALTNAWTSRLINKMLRGGLLVSRSEDIETRFGWGRLLEIMQKFGGSKYPYNLTTIDTDGIDIVERRFSGADVARGLCLVCEAEVEAVQIVYEPYRIVSRTDVGVDGESLVSDRPRRFQSRQISGFGKWTTSILTRARDVSFSAMGSEHGWDSWTRNAAQHFEQMGARSVHERFCPRDIFEKMIRSPDTDFYYHLCHGGNSSFEAGDEKMIYESEVVEWMEDRLPMQFTFIGSCGGMSDTGPGTLSWAFSKGDETCAVLGYVRMGERGSGWTVSLPWQDFLFKLAMQEGVTIYEAILRAQSKYPQMSKNWGFWGNGDLILKVRTLSSERSVGGVRVMWKRASGKPEQLSVDELKDRSHQVLLERCGGVANELFLDEHRRLEEKDTGAFRYQFYYRRRYEGILVMDDYVSIELDPHDGELIGFHKEIGEALPTSEGKIGIDADQARQSATAAASQIFHDKAISYQTHSLNLKNPYLVYTSELPFVEPNKILVYLVPVSYTRSNGEESETAILVDPRSGEVVGMIPPPP